MENGIVGIFVAFICNYFCNYFLLLKLLLVNFYFLPPTNA